MRRLVLSTTQKTSLQNIKNNFRPSAHGGGGGGYKPLSFGRNSEQGSKKKRKKYDRKGMKEERSAEN
jgi:hypothetical protein